MAEAERGRTADELWEDAIGDMRRAIEAEGPAAWDDIVRRYDQYSLYEFLRSRGWSDGAIEYYAVMNFVEADMHNAVVEVLREDLGGATSTCSASRAAWTRCRNAFFAELQDEVRLGAEVFRHRAGSRRRHGPLQDRGGPGQRARATTPCAPLPFPVLRTVEVTPELSRAKQRAIRQLNYHASTKILFQVRERVWETDDGILGGATVTDLPVRRLNYPPPDPTTARGVLLASYTWGQDALQWGAMDEETRLEEALDDVSRIHPRIRDVYEAGASYAWYGDRWARGAFALFAPEQQSELQADILRPEGRILFAGEHCSLYHAWIQGALESGIRAARPSTRTRSRRRPRGSRARRPVPRSGCRPGSARERARTDLRPARAGRPTLEGARCSSASATSPPTSSPWTWRRARRSSASSTRTCC